MPNKTQLREIFLGVGKYDRPFYWTLGDSTAHLGLSLITGMGKSTFCRTCAAQFIHWGGRVVIFDSAKAGDSHGDWCRLPDGSLLQGVELYRTIEEVHNGLIAWAKERHRRSDSSYRRTGEDWQPVLVIFEEMNATIGTLRNHWPRIKESGDSVRSPAVDALLDLTAAGRSASIHCLLVAQKLTAATCGSDAVRENLGIKILGGCSQRTWKMLTNDQVAYPKNGLSTRPGDVTAVIGTQCTELHVADITAEQTQEWALSGAPQPIDAGLRLPSRDLPSQRDVTFAAAEPSHIHRENSCEEVRAAKIEPAFDLPPEEITLADAVALEVVRGVSLASLRKAAEPGAQGDPTFPGPVGTGKRGAKLYAWQDLMSWNAGRSK